MKDNNLLYFFLGAHHAKSILILALAIGTILLLIGLIFFISTYLPK